MDFKLNFIGVTVRDFPASFRFYTETLGMVALASRADWALFDTTGMTFELFGGGVHKGGESQAIIPLLHMTGAEDFIGTLSQKGVQFDGEVAYTTGASSVEFFAPEGLRWRLIVSFPSSTITPLMPLPPPLGGTPRIKDITLMTGYDRLQALDQFYDKVMGLSCIDRDVHWRHFGQEPGEPELYIWDRQGAGKPRPPLSSRREAPHYISFETGNIESAAEWLRSRQVLIMQDVTHQQWGGIDMHVLDPDNNPVQVVQYP